MNRVEKALQNHEKGYNCAQSVLCAFSDITPYSEDELFKMSEAFGGGMGVQGVCGAVSAMVILAGMLSSFGIEKLPETNKIKSYNIAKTMIKEFENLNATTVCSQIKSEKLRSCDGCIEDAVKIVEEIML